MNVHICGDFEGREASDSLKEAQTANSSEKEDTQGGGNLFPKVTAAPRHAYTGVICVFRDNGFHFVSKLTKKD